MRFLFTKINIEHNKIIKILKDYDEKYFVEILESKTILLL